MTDCKEHGVHIYTDETEEEEEDEEAEAAVEDDEAEYDE